MARKKSTEQIIDDQSQDAAVLAAAMPAAPAVRTDAIRAALAVVSQSIRAEAHHQLELGQFASPERAARIRLSIALSSIAARIESANAPAGTAQS